MKNILHLMGMDVSKYGSFERFNIELSRQLTKRGFHSVFVYEKKPVVADYVEDLLATGAEIRILPCLGYSKVKFCWHLWNLFKEYEFCFMHAHFTKARFFAIPLAYLYGLRNIVYTLHSTIEPLSKIKLHTRLWYWWANRHCRIIAVSKQIESVTHQNWPKAEVRNLYMGVSPIVGDKYRCRKELNLPMDKILVMCTANFNQIKGLDILVKAIKIIADQRSLANTLFVIVGQPENDLRELASLVKTLNLEEYIRLEGISNMVANYLCAADIYTQPSRHEGLPLALMEACSVGLPIVASRVGGIPEIAVDGKNAVLFESENSEELAVSLHNVIDNEEMRKAYGNNSLMVYKEFFCLETNVSEIINYYNL